jgi:tetratricopeptide (TPR) repeat protein
LKKRRLSAALAGALLAAAMPIAAHAAAQSDYEIGAAACQAKNYAKAEKSFLQGLKQTPSDPNLHYGLANVYQALGQNDKAKEEYRRVLDLAHSPKLEEYARRGLSFIDTRQAMTAAPLPAPTPPRFSIENQGSIQWQPPTTAWHPQQPFPSAPQPGMPPFTMQTSSRGGGFGYGSLPSPTPPSYGPGAGGGMGYGMNGGMGGYQPMIGYMGYGRHHHHRYGGGGYQPHNYTAYSPYAFGPPHPVVMEVRTYRPAPPLNIQDPKAIQQQQQQQQQAQAQKPQEPQIELMAKQQKLVVDNEKPAK